MRNIQVYWAKFGFWFYADYTYTVRIGPTLRLTMQWQRGSAAAAAMSGGGYGGRIAECVPAALTLISPPHTNDL